jgi:hypothetical protein
MPDRNPTDSLDTIDNVFYSGLYSISHVLVGE